jgi:hypothetical protein
MHKFGNLLLGLLLLSLSSAIQAQDILRVNAMNYPAWVIRNHQTLALRPGYQLRNNDLIRTGKNGRVLLQLNNGSAVNIGESARFLIESAEPTDEQGESSPATSLQILRGAFRFTSSFFRDISTGQSSNLKIGAIAAKTRDADIWGHSTREQDLIVLIEGTVSIEVNGEPAIILDQAQSTFLKPNASATSTVDLTSVNQLKAWKNETELDRSRGVARHNGKWSVVLVSLATLNGANRALKKFHEMGYAVTRKSVIRQGKTLHRLLLTGFASVEDAVNGTHYAADYLAINDAWVWRQK